MNAMTPSSQDPTDSFDRCVLATTYLLVPGFDQRAVGLDHHGPRAVAIAEGEVRAPSVVVDSLLGHTVDAAAAHLRFQRLDRQPSLGASKSAAMVISPSPMVTTDDGGRSRRSFVGEGGFIAEFRPGEKLMQSSWISASASGSPTKPHR